jgi:hypothetical protein
MHIHANAKLTIKQREEVKRLSREEKIGYRKLAARFGVNLSTIQRWVHRDCPLDKTTAPLHPRTVVTEAYRAAVIRYRQANPAHGPIRVAQALQGEFPQAHRGTVLPILRQAGLTRPPRQSRPFRRPIPVGRHRVQMDIQQLPAVKGGQGFEYKISLIHLRTRYKYSEIHPDMRSVTVAAVLRRGLDRLPPFFSSGPTTP